jgi:hypothetical protein
MPISGIRLSDQLHREAHGGGAMFPAEMEEACRYSDRPLAFLARYGFISSSDVETPHWREAMTANGVLFCYE